MYKSRKQKRSQNDNETTKSIIMESIRKVKRNVLPEDGGWVIIRGSRMAPRGLRIPTAIRAEGVKHFDIYYAYNEETPNWGSQFEELAYCDEEEIEEVIDECLANLGISDDQLTWMDLHTPSSKHIRMWAGEVSPISRGLIDEMLAEGYIKPVSFVKVQNNPVWDEITRDLIGSLMLDGLTEQQAQDELLRAGEDIERKWTLPNIYYEPIGEFRDTFSEEPEYEEWVKERGEKC